MVVSQVALTRALYGHVPETNLLLLPVENLQFGERLSPTTVRAAERALRFLDRQLARWVAPSRQATRWLAHAR